MIKATLLSGLFGAVSGALYFEHVFHPFYVTLIVSIFTTLISLICLIVITRLQVANYASKFTASCIALGFILRATFISKPEFNSNVIFIAAGIAFVLTFYHLVRTLAATDRIDRNKSKGI